MMSNYVQSTTTTRKFSQVQSLLDNRTKKSYFMNKNRPAFKPAFVYKNKTYIRPGYVPIQNEKRIEPPSLLPSPKYLQMEREIEEAVLEEQEFEGWMNECYEQQQNTLLEDEYEFIRDTCQKLMN